MQNVLNLYQDSMKVKSGTFDSDGNVEYGFERYYDEETFSRLRVLVRLSDGTNEASLDDIELEFLVRVLKILRASDPIIKHMITEEVMS